MVRTDLSTEPYYLDITDALTGVVLGDAFPNDRIPALLAMLAGFDNVELLQARFHNRSLHLFPRERQVESEPALRPMSATTSTIPPRRSGDLAQRLGSLEDAERTADIDREAAIQVAAPVLQAWHEGLAERPELYANWTGVVVNHYRRATAIPAEDRSRRPGVPGEVIAYEAGLMVIGEHQPQHSFTWVMAIALQVMPNGAGRLHACITTEEWRSEGNNLQELYRDLRATNPDEILEASSQVLASLVEAVPDARSMFDELRGERAGS